MPVAPLFDRREVGINEGVVQSTDAGDDGHITITQAIQLRQAAGLKSARYQDGIATALHQMRKRFVITRMNRHMGWVLVLFGVQCGFQARIA